MGGRVAGTEIDGRQVRAGRDEVKRGEVGMHVPIFDTPVQLADLAAQAVFA